MRNLSVWRRLELAEEQLAFLAQQWRELDMLYRQALHDHDLTVAQLKTALAHVEARYDAFQALTVQTEMARRQGIVPRLTQKFTHWVDTLLGIPPD